MYVCIEIVVLRTWRTWQASFPGQYSQQRRKALFFPASVSLEHMAHGEIQFQTQKRALGNQLAPEPHFIGEIQPSNIITFSSVTSLCGTDKMVYCTVGLRECRCLGSWCRWGVFRVERKGDKAADTSWVSSGQEGCGCLDRAGSVLSSTYVLGSASSAPGSKS